MSAVQSDPEYLPRHCASSAIRFLGDYNISEGDLLHGHLLHVVVPDTDIATDVKLGFGCLGSWFN